MYCPTCCTQRRVREKLIHTKKEDFWIELCVKCGTCLSMKSLDEVDPKKKRIE